ncbi:MAG: hypothetical protein OEX77_06560 [Candidatus Bathyarchaeota archaeon]|nr:hypothetical protein [Candidatus Bathyarchaeota archaeon]MDH5733536.1 hypothetical protein [Candidatus Bathyarchaeota archaeon]
MMFAGALWMRSFRKNKRGVSNVIVFVLGLVIVTVIVANVFLWNFEMNQLDWEKMQEDFAIVNVARLGEALSYNPSVYVLEGSTDIVSGSISNLTADDSIYMTFRSYHSWTGVSDVVDEISDLYSPSAKGIHSNFSAQQVGPDGVMDTLSESNTHVQWTSPTGHEDPGNEWLDETNAYDNDTETYATDDVPGGDTWSQYLALNHSAITCGGIRYYIGREDAYINQVEIGIYNGITWTDVYSGVGTWNAWTNVSFAETPMTQMRFRFFNTMPAAPQKRMAYVYEVDFLQGLSPANYEVDLQVQWASVDYDETNEELCIYTGDMGSEDLRVEYWTGSTWSNLLSALTANNWNNVSVSLTSATFTIRFKAGNETGDATQDSWNIDVALLSVWSDHYTMEAEFIGSSNTEDWNQLNWTIDSAWTVSSVAVTLQLHNYTLDGYPTSGNGYMSYTSSAIADTDEVKRQTITVNPTHFRNTTGYWKMKVKGVKATDTQFDFKADWIEFKPIKASGSRFTFENTGSLTCHLVSLWVINSTVHQHYDIDVFINSGDIYPYVRSDISLLDGQFTVRTVTERGNMEVYSVDYT